LVVGGTRLAEPKLTRTFATGLKAEQIAWTGTTSLVLVFSSGVVFSQDSGQTWRQVLPTAPG
jgi:hypothetical protein